MKRTFLLIVFLIAMIFPLTGLDLPEFNSVNKSGLAQILRTFDTIGLDHALVTFIFQDSKGFIWIGSENGLYRYDGRETRSFKYDYRDENSLSHNYVSSMVESINGILWVGTAGGGVCRFDRETGKCKRYDIGREKMSRRNFVSKLLLTREGSLYVSTLDGLSVFNKEFDRFELIPGRNLKEQLIIRTMIVLSDETLMLGTVKGLEFLSLKKKEFLEPKEFVKLKEEMSVFSFKKLLNRNILIGVDGGVFVFDPEKKEVISFNEYFGVTIPVGDAIFYSFIEKDKTLYLGTGKGLIVKSKTNKIDHLLKGSAITSLLMDRSGVFWVGDYYKGVKKYSVFKSRFAESDIISSFVDKEKVTVSSIIESEKFYWAGTTSNGLFRIDKTDGSFIKIQVHGQRSKSRVGDKHVRSLVMDRDKTLWIGTSKGLKYLKRIDTDLESGYLNVKKADAG